ncbi:MAG: Butirosin biosynthesis protein N-terminal, partial [Solirubrobacterales bacterium]|nr:Butirosin biosynthesis protein N-terminal [Solirubrobacterales bacterium]
SLAWRRVSTTLPESFAHTRAGHCGSGSLRDLLAFHGLDFGAGPLSEGTVFGLAGGLGFLYASTPGQHTPYYLVGRTATAEEDVARHLGLGLELRETDDPAEGWAWVKDELDAGRPPMVWADIMELEYLRVRMHNSRHLIVLVGYDEAEGVAWIADNDREDLQRCSLTSLAAARNSPAFPGPNRHRVYLYDWPDALPPATEAIRAALGTALENMTSGGTPIAGLDGGTGLAGVDAFASAYAGWPAAFGDGLEAALKGLWVFVVKAGTGGAMFRSLHAGFLRDAADLLEDARLASLADTYDALSAAWVALADAAAAGDHAGGLPHVDAIARLEHEGVAATQAWLAAGAAAR